MNRTLFTIGAVLSTSSLLLVDSAIKGGVLLLLAALVAVLLRRDSAATRHLVWQVSIVGMLVVPVFSAVLPQWRVLPAWAVISRPAAAPTTNALSEHILNQAEASAPIATELTPSLPDAMPLDSPPASRVRIDVEPIVVHETDGEVPTDQAAVVSVETISNPPLHFWSALDVLPILWLIGFSVLMVRLMAARLMLWSGERRGRLVVASQSSTLDERKHDRSDEAIVDAFKAGCQQLSVSRPVRLLIHSEQTIPVVWGILRLRLLLPANARSWSAEQLQSVLLHELAHIKRRDAIAQLLAQIACALHWFNPLVWIAAWRLHVERERACDDLVLANGVPPSAYAEHLLDVATRLSTAPWTQVCGLAMARKSSLEGRLVAVLSQKRNRRSVSATLGTVTLIAGVGLAIPLAMLRSTDGAMADEVAMKTGVTDDPDSEFPDPKASEAPAQDEDSQDSTPGDKVTDAGIEDDPPVVKKPIKNEEAADTKETIRKPAKEDRTRVWAGLFAKSALHHRQKDGSYPPRAFNYLRNHVAEALKRSPNRRYAAEAHAWMEATAVQKNWSADEFLDVVQNIYKWDFESFHNARRDEAFAAKYFPKPGQIANPENLKGLSFGAAAENGLRVAWGLDPSKKEYAVGEIVKFRVMIHNSGNRTVQFIGPVEQGGKPSIREEQVTATHILHANFWLAPNSSYFQRYRLEPGQSVEFRGRHVGIGMRKQAASLISSASKPRLIIWPLDAAQHGDVILFSVETELGRSDSQTLKASDGATLPVAVATPFYMKDELPDEQARDWSGVLRSGVVKINVVAAVDPSTTPAEPTLVKPAPAKNEPTNVPDAEPIVELKPKDRVARELFSIWQANARTDGKIPGALIGRLGEMVEYFNQLNKDEVKELVAKFEALLPRFDATVDWSQADAVALLDDVAAVHSIPLLNTLNIAEQRVILTGEPLPPELVDAPWGEPADNGLRVAWHLSPRAKEYRLGTSLKSRILVHNSGEETVIFSMPSWQQSSTHTARDANDNAIKVSSTDWTTMASMKIVRLAPGAYYETPAPGIGVGPRTEDEDWAHIRPGAWIEAKKGDDVRFTPGRIEVRSSPRAFGTSTVDGRPTNTDPKDATELWDRIVTERLDREMPLPTGAADRAQLLRRVVRDLYDVEPDQGEIDAYVADKSPGAVHPIAGRDLLKTRVQQGRKLSPFTGTLPSGDIAFRVLAADPDAANRPRVATGPGFYNLGDKPRLVISQTRNGRRLINSATIQFHMRYYYSDKNKPAPGPHAISLPEGRLTYAIAWDRDATELWILQKGLARRYDFSDPYEVKETQFKPDGTAKIPERFRKAIKVALDVPGAPVQQRASQATSGVKLPAGFEEHLQWGQPVNGLRAALIRPPALGSPESRQTKDFQMVVQNVSKAPVRLVADGTAPNPRELTLMSRKHGWIHSKTRVEEPSKVDFLLQPGDVAVLDMLRREGPQGPSISRNLDVVFFGKMSISKAPPGAWTGTLATAGMQAAFAAHGLLPKHKDARALFITWNQGIRWNRMFPGGLIGLLAERVKTFTDSNPTWRTTPQLLKLLPRLDATRDWEPLEVLSLLDEVAAIQASPIQAMLEREIQNTMRTGKPLPKDLENAPWGAAHSNGLRVAWMLDPTAKEYRLGTPLKSRILFHNSGQNVVVFRTQNWRQSSQHKAKDANDADIRISSTSWTTRAHLVPFRLNPGEFVEVAAAGIGIGPRDAVGASWKGTRVGSWIEAQAGDEVTFTPYTVSVRDRKPPTVLIGEDNWWYGFITARLAREKPLPMDDEVRKRLVYHVALDLGTSHSDEVTKVFLADRSPNALDNLARRLVEQSNPVPFAGTLKSGPTTFRVLAAARKTADAATSSSAKRSSNQPVPADRPAAATTNAAELVTAAAKPSGAIRPATERPTASRKGPVHSANHSGNYRLKEGRGLVVCRPTVVKPWLAVVWDAIGPWPESRLRIYPKVSEKNYRNWAVAWEPDADDLWYVDDTGVTHVDVANPAEVLTTRQDFDKPAVLIFKLPEQVRQEFRRLGFEIPRSKQSPDNHVTDGQAMLAGESLKTWTIEGTVTGQDGKPMTDVPIRIRTEYHPTIDVATTKTDAKGNYRVNFRLDLRTIARYRGVQVEPVLDGFTERDAEESGLFDALLHEGEKPHSVKVRRYPPIWITGVRGGENKVGPIRRFSKRDLILGQFARADFVMLPASVITGEIVDPDGNPQASRYVSVSAPDTVRPRGYETVASAQSDNKGRFKLTNIPANELLNFTSSIPGRNWEVSKSASQIFGPAAIYRIRIVTGPGGKGELLRIARDTQQVD